jgi:hypothetical protein
VRWEATDAFTIVYYDIAQPHPGKELSVWKPSGKTELELINCNLGRKVTSWYIHGQASVNWPNSKSDLCTALITGTVQGLGISKSFGRALYSSLYRVFESLGTPQGILVVSERVLPMKSTNQPILVEELTVDSLINGRSITRDAY